MSASTGMMPELGSKISLISKADIRYEGRLFTVDPQECTIALANVRSFGTEDRETPYPIAPQPTVYDYILFRGSDIKDIRVVNNVAIPNDPAIMQMHLPPSQMPSQQQGFPPQNFPPMQPQPGQYAPFGQMQGPPINIPGPNISQQQPQQSLSPPNPQQQQQSQSNQDSRSGTPNARKSPTSDMGVQTNQNRENNGGNKERMQRNHQRNMNNRERRDSGRNNNNERNNEMHENKGGYRQHPQHQHNRMQQNRGGYNNHNNRNMNMNNQMRGNQGGSGRMRAPNYYRPNHQNKQNNGIAPPRGNNNKNTLKFENEFDFEQANSKFEELRSQLAKLKVGEENKNNEPQVNGEAEKKDDSGNETGADHDQEADDVVGYDKTKSFFDNISCEASERSKGKPNRPDWRQERKINSETFGLSMNRRGNMRGRGYYRTQYNNRPNYRPGVPPQYRNSNNRNNNNNNRNVPNNSGSGGRTNTNTQQGQQQPNQNQQPVAAK